jgi:hypothetical protein
MGGPHSSHALRQWPVSEGKLKIYEKEIDAVRTLIFFIFVASPQSLRQGARGELQCRDSYRKTGAVAAG